MAHTEPTTEEVDFFLSMLAGLLEAGLTKGQANALHRVAVSGMAQGTVSLDTVSRYKEMEELAKTSCLTHWEGIRGWMTEHLPPSTPCSDPDHDHPPT